MGQTRSQTNQGGPGTQSRMNQMGRTRSRIVNLHRTEMRLCGTNAIMNRPRGTNAIANEWSGTNAIANEPRGNWNGTTKWDKCDREQTEGGTPPPNLERDRERTDGRPRSLLHWAPCQLGTALGAVTLNIVWQTFVQYIQSYIHVSLHY